MSIVQRTRHFSDVKSAFNNQDSTLALMLFSRSWVTLATNAGSRSKTHCPSRWSRSNSQTTQVRTSIPKRLDVAVCGQSRIDRLGRLCALAVEDFGRFASGSCIGSTAGWFRPSSGRFNPRGCFQPRPNHCRHRNPAVLPGKLGRVHFESAVDPAWPRHGL